MHPGQLESVDSGAEVEEATRDCVVVDSSDTVVSPKIGGGFNSIVGIPAPGNSVAKPSAEVGDTTLSVVPDGRSVDPSREPEGKIGTGKTDGMVGSIKADCDDPGDWVSAGEASVAVGSVVPCDICCSVVSG